MLKERTNCTIVGSKPDAHRIPGIDIKLEDQEVFSFGAHRVTLLETPGHTLGSVCYFVEPSKIPVHRRHSVFHGLWAPV